MKKLFALILSVFMVAMALSGCSGKGNTQSNSKGVENQVYAKSGAKLIETKYPTADAVIADIVATEAPYNLDNTGKKDCTEGLQQAINDCVAIGGGTVFLPVGQYRITNAIHINPFVTLRGDWQDPDKGQEYGTIILADVESTAEDLPALFSVYGSAGVVGLTVYYPAQDINKVKPYPYTFYVPSDMLQTISNCTVINGYKGIGATFDGGHEMMTIDTVKGTFLNNAAKAYNQSDVGTWKSLTASSKYWAEAKGTLKSADKTKIEAYTKANGIGLILGDLEWTQFSNVLIEGYNVGVNIVKGVRIEFAGALYNFTINNCNTGLKVDNIDERWGMVVANSKISGTKNAIVNSTQGAVKLADVETVGAVTGNTDFIIGKDKKVDFPTTDYAKSYKKPVSKLYNTADYKVDISGLNDCSKELQKAIDAAVTTGGVVYMPAGLYRLDKPITVPANVELRGASSVANRDQTGSSNGTIILSYYGDKATDFEKDAALITLVGENSGINGLRIFYPKNNPVKNDKKSVPHTYAIRATAKGVYATNLGLGNVHNGIDFNGCDNFFIKKVVSAGFSKTFQITNSSNGTIEGCLQNGTVAVRQALYQISDFSEWVSETQIFDYILNPITRKNTVYISLTGCKNTTIYNCFGYGIKNLIIAENSENTFVFNIGADNLGETGVLLTAKGGSMTVANMMRYNGRSYKKTSSKLNIYNRLTIANKSEEDITTE